MTWSVSIGAQPAPLVLEILNAHEIWRKLTPRQRAVILNPGASMHPLTRRALVAHGLWEGDGLTEAGRITAKWNQPKTRRRWEIDVRMVMRGRPLTLNDRMHWRVKAELVRIIRNSVAWQAKQQRIGALKHATIQLHYAPGRGGKHDADNLVATSKPAVDGLRDAGVIVDDSTEHVTQLMPTIHPGKGVRRCWLEIQEDT